jgi:hypothetical protein
VKENLTCQGMMMVDRFILNWLDQILSFFEFVVEEQMLRKIGDFYSLLDYVLRYKFLKRGKNGLNLPLTLSSASSKLSSSAIFFCLKGELSWLLKNIKLL